MRGLNRLLGTATSVVFLLGLMVMPVAAVSNHSDTDQITSQNTEQDQQSTGEACPTSTQLLVTFSWNGGYSPDGGNAMGVSVAGDNNTAYWVSGQTIAAIVVSAGGETRHITLDHPETTGSISPHNYEVFGGGTIESLGFCVGPKVNPDSGSGASVEIVKTAACATLNQDGTATVTGQIAVDNHDRRTARITSALDTVLGPGNQALARTTVAGLVGVVLVEDEVITVDYAVTFDPMGFQGFDNFIEVTIERADNGAARHKVYNDRAAFVLCQQPAPPEQPEEEQGELIVIKVLCEGEAPGVAFFVNDPEAPVEGCTAADAELTLLPLAMPVELEDGMAELTLDVGSYSLEETAPNQGTSGTFQVVDGGETVVVVINYFTEDELPSGGGPGGDDDDDDKKQPKQPKQPKPREDTKGGTLPDTALETVTGSTPALLLALVMLTGIGAAAYATATEARRRR